LFDNIIFIGLVGLIAMGFSFAVGLLFNALSLLFIGVKVAVKMIGGKK